MISILIILALSAVAIAALVTYWKNILEWIKKAVNKIKEVLNLQPDGTKTFISRAAEGFQNKSKYYYKSKMTSEWEEVVYTKPVNENEVPADILAKVRRQAINIEIDTTQELKLAINA